MSMTSLLFSSHSKTESLSLVLGNLCIFLALPGQDGSDYIYVYARDMNMGMKLDHV